MNIPEYNPDIKSSIQEILDKNDCTSCGLCMAICPEHAIRWNENGNRGLPEIDTAKCTECSICYKLCPAVTIDEQGTDNGPVLIFSVNAHSVSDRLKGTSGGFYRVLASELLKQGKYDMAAFASYREGALFADLMLTDSNEEIMQSSHSVYLPVNIGNVVEYLLNHRKKRIIIVGTACTVNAVHNVIGQYGLNRDNYLLIGLFCNAVMNNDIIKYFIRTEEGHQVVKTFDFRNKERNGWPGDVKIEFSSGKNVYISRKDRMLVKDRYYLNRCLHCDDKYNVKADISIGDDYTESGEMLGKNIIIIRTHSGKEIFNKVKDLFDTAPADSRVLKKKELEKAALSIKKTHVKSDWLKYKYYFPAVLLGLIRKNEQYSRKIKGKILITGASVSNDGAYMMYKTTEEILKRLLPDKKIITYPDILNADYRIKENSDLNVYYNEIRSLLNPFSRKKSGIRKMLNDVMIVVDISGFALRSRWEFRHNLKYIFRIVLFNLMRIPVMIMPQSMGPFNTDLNDWRILSVFNKVSALKLRRIFLRERISAQNAEKIGFRHTKVFPDIVFRNSVFRNKPPIEREKSVLIIPSRKLIDESGLEKYLKDIESVCEFLNSREYSVKFIATADEDSQLAFALSDLTGNEFIQGLRVEDKLEMIRKSRFIISSRYHPAVFALAYTVPVIALGWSHKYSTLLSLFNQKEYYIDALKNERGKRMLNAVERMDKSNNICSDVIKTVLDNHIRNEMNLFEKEIQEFILSLK